METVEELKKRIAELEEELKQWKDGTIIVKWTNAENRVKELEEENKQLNNYNEELRKNYEKCIDFWKQENAKLQEQLKNAIVPKYEIGDTIWCVSEKEVDVYSFVIEEIRVEKRSQKKEIISYWGKNKWCFDYEAFATEVEAQKYLEERK